MVIQTPENLLGSPLEGTKKKIHKRYLKLEAERSSWRSHWMEITDYLLPRRGRYLIESKSTRGRRRTNKIINNTGGMALRTLSAGMMSGLTSPARPWFRLQTKDRRVMEMSGVKRWLGETEQVIRGVLNSSNFYNAMPQLYSELGAFGTSPLLRRTHPSRLVHYRPFTAGEYIIAENDYLEVDTLGRRFVMTVAQIVEQFIWNPVSQKMDWEKTTNAVKNLWDRGDYDEEVEVVHMIQPRRKELRDMRRMDGAHRPWADVYVEFGSDKDQLLRESGYFRKPFFVPRWDVLGGDTYGYAPAMDALGDIKQLQHEEKRKAQGIDKMVNPPMTAALSLKGKPTTVLPGGTTYVDPMQGGQGFQPAYMVQPRVQELMLDIQEVGNRINRALYADLFAMMINSDRRQITATEVAERHEEKLVLLGPVLQRLNTELLDPLIEDAFILALEAGLVPPLPEAMEGEEIEIKYVSLLAQAQEAAAAASMERTLSFAGSIAAIDDSVLDNFDLDEAVREYSDILGNSPKVLRERDAVTERRRQRQEEAQRQAAMAQAAEAADAAKTLSEADTQSPNALTDLLQRGRTVVQ